MKVGITGATGFVGQALTRAYQEDGHEVFAFGRDKAKIQRLLPGATPVTSPDGVTPIPAVDAVINLAGETVAGLWSAGKKRRILDSRVNGTKNLVNSIRLMSDKPKALVSASGIGYYGDRGEEVLDEQSGPGEGFLTAVCLAWEAEAMKAMEIGVRTTVIRLAVVLGHGGALGPILLPFKLGLGGPMGSGNQWFPWIHIDDLVDAIRFLVDGELSGPIVGGSPNPVRQKDFAKILGKVIHRPALMPAPGFVMRTVIGGFASELLDSRRAAPKALTEAGFVFRYPALRTALEDSVK